MYPLTPSFLQALAPAGAEVSEVPSQWPQRYSGTVPCNHFTLNDAQDCLEAASWLEENLDSSTGKHTHTQKYLQAYCFLYSPL